MTDDYTPENADATQPPESLETDYTCGECGESFETADALGRHTADCDGQEDDESD